MYKAEVTECPIEEVDKVWGAEHWIVNSPSYCMKFLLLMPGRCSSLHYHRQKDETFYVDSGVAFLEIDGEVIELHQGQSVRVKPNQAHKFWNPKDSKEEVVIIEISTHHDEADVYRIEESKIL